uniref:Hyaluronan/mRNA-binding protein domain-containing protein n=1 Tax=Salix viminalis TaxID=40686 RepID=A0A6N2K6T5_SALVM
MATENPFDILGDDDNNEDLSQLVAAAQLKAAEKPKKADKTAAAPASQPARLPTKPAPPAQAVREAKNEGGRVGGRGYGRGRGRGGRFNRDSNNNEMTFTGNGFTGVSRPSEDGEAGRTSERHGYGAPWRFPNELKREGSGRGNWGTPDEIALETEEPVVDNEKNNITEKQPEEEDAAAAGKDAVDASKDAAENEPEEKEPEAKEMTLEEYEKVLEEKRKALLSLKAEERKVGLDKDLQSMQQLSNKKSNDEIFIKLGSEKDKRKDAADKEDRAKKAVSINEFLKPAGGDRYHNPGRGRGRGRGRGGYGGNARDVEAPSIEDPGQFPTLGGK